MSSEDSLAMILADNRNVVSGTSGHRGWEYTGKGVCSDPFKFDIAGHPHEAFRKAVIEAITRKSQEAYFMLDGRKMRVQLPKIKRIDSNWVLYLRHELFVHQNEIKMPSPKSTRGRTFLFSLDEVELFEVHVSNA